MRSNNFKVLIATGIVCAIVTNGIQFGIQYKLNSNTKAKYESQISKLRETLDEIGELVTCYTVSAPKAEAGDKVVSEEVIEEVNIPESCVQDSYITDYSEIKDKEFKIDIHKGTPLTKDMFMSEELDDSTRHIDISASVFPTDLSVGDYVDFRIIYPKGEDFIVLPKVRIDSITENTVNVRLDEEGIMFYDAAVVDNFMKAKAGSVLYMTKYVEPGLQEKAKRTYTIPTNIQSVVMNNPNIVQDIEQGTISRDIMERFGLTTNEESSALSSGRGALITKLQQAREAFVQNKNEAQDLSDANDFEDALSVDDGTATSDSSSNSNNSDNSNSIDPNPNNSLKDISTE